MMLLLDLPNMAKTEEDADKPRQIRVFHEIADMLGWLEHFSRQDGPGENIAQIVQKWLEAPVTGAYLEIKERAERSARALGIKFKPGTVPPPPGRKKMGKHSA